MGRGIIVDKNIEIERKWLVDINNLPINIKKYKCLKIEQGYLIKKPAVRIRKVNNKYFLTVKTDKNNTGIVRNEYEVNISKNDYEYLIKQCRSNVIKKNRYLIPYNNNLIQLDVFLDMYAGLIYAEVEFSNVNEAKKFKQPEWFGKELTNDKKTTNSSLAFKNINKV